MILQSNFYCNPYIHATTLETIMDRRRERKTNLHKSKMWRGGLNTSTPSKAMTTNIKPTNTVLETDDHDPQRW